MKWMVWVVFGLMPGNTFTRWCSMLVGLIGLEAVSGPCASGDDDYLQYAIPPDAVRIGPGSERDPEKSSINYFLAGCKPSLETFVGKEVFYRKQLIERCLYKGMNSYGMQKLHGVQRKWFKNGILKSEEPYKDDVMHGHFRYWNEQGQRIGDNVILDGRGTIRIYDDQGVLVKEREFKNSQPDGLSMEMFGELRRMMWFKNGRLYGKELTFYPNNALSRLTTCLPEEFTTTSFSSRHGPWIRFSKEGLVTEKQWYVNEKEVTESAYAQAAKKDSTLLPHHADAREYLNVVDDKVKALLDRYTQMPRVKIPLELDREGHPVLAVKSP